MEVFPLGHKAYPMAWGIKRNHVGNTCCHFSMNVFAHMKIICCGQIIPALYVYGLEFKKKCMDTKEYVSLHSECPQTVKLKTLVIILFHFFQREHNDTCK